MFSTKLPTKGMENMTNLGDGNWSLIACSTHHSVIEGPKALTLIFLVIYSALANILLVRVQFPFLISPSVAAGGHGIVHGSAINALSIAARKIIMLQHFNNLSSLSLSFS